MPTKTDLKIFTGAAILVRILNRFRILDVKTQFLAQMAGKLQYSKELNL